MNKWCACRAHAVEEGRARVGTARFCVATVKVRARLLPALQVRAERALPSCVAAGRGARTAGPALVRQRNDELYFQAFRSK